MAKWLMINIMLLALLFTGTMPASGLEDYQVISGDLILEVARSYIYSHSPWKEHDVTVEFKREMADVPAYLRGKVTLEVEQLREGGLADVNLLKVRIDIDGEPYARIDVGPYLSIKMPVVVAAVDIDRGHLIGDADVRIETCDLTVGHLNEPLTDTKTVVGMSARQGIRQGEAVLSRHIDLPVLVERGKDVTALVRAGGLNITMTVQALDNGRLGDSVRVKNKTSGAVITGEVIGLRYVEVRI